MSILQRDGFTCQYCGAKAPAVKLEVDHVVPVAEGGAHTADNLATACWPCNNGKRARMIFPPDWETKDHRIPKKRMRQRPMRVLQPPKPSLGIVASCSCGKPADTIHFLPWITVRRNERQHIIAACRHHDPGGYWLRISDLNESPDRWINHLRESKSGPAHKMLLSWIVKHLGHDAGLKKLYGAKPYAMKWSVP